MSSGAIERAAQHAGLELDPRMTGLLRRLTDWLAEEALPAGGVGPAEGDRVAERHVADSLLLATAWRGSPPPAAILDLGTGAGLPALPLAIAHPESRVVAVDRSHRKVLLARRGARVLALPNLTVEETDFARLQGSYRAVVARAAAAPALLLPHLRRLTASDGVAVVAASRVTPVSVAGFRTLEVPAGVLDRPVWLLIMAPS